MAPTRVHMLLCLIILNVDIGRSLFGCDKLTIIKTTHNPQVEGVYRPQVTTCEDEASYLQESGANSLYQHTRIGSNDSLVVVGTTVCGDDVALAAPVPDSDDELPETWMENNNGKWEENPLIIVTCERDDDNGGLSPGAIAGIIIGCLVGVALIIAVTVLATMRCN